MNSGTYRAAVLAVLVLVTTTQWAVTSVSASPPPAAAVAWTGAPTPGIDTLAIGSDGALWMKAWDAHSWGGWAALSETVPGWPGTSSAPAVTSWGPDRMDIFVRGNDNALWHMWWNGGWGGWESLGGSLASAPAVASWSANRLDVFARGTDNTLQHLWWDGVGWRGWESLGGVLTSAPAVASWAPGRLDVFARGASDGLVHIWYSSPSWSAWQSLGGVLASDPAAVSWGPGRIDVFAEGADTQLIHTWFQGGWYGVDGTGAVRFEGKGGVLSSAPAVASWAPGQLDVFVRGSDGAEWQIRWGTQGWSGWNLIGGLLGASPAATAWRAAANVVQGVPYVRQVRALSCEEAALQMALAHQGISASQDRILNDIGVDGRPGHYDSRRVLHWGDPYVNYVGNPNGSEVNLTGYGTYDIPIARAAAGHGANLIAAGEQVSPQAVYDAVLGNHPVVAWVSFDWRYHRHGSWIAFDGRVVQYEGPVEHTVTVVGVNQSQVYVYNPWSGPQWVSRSTFEAAYLTYNDMAVILQ